MIENLNRIKEIGLKDFMEIEKISEDNEIDRDVAFLSVISKIPTEKILDLPLTEFAKLKNSLTFLQNSESKQVPKLTFKLDNVLYGYRNDIEKMTVAEYIDADTISSSENSSQNLHVVMAILYRPIIKHGNLEKNSMDYVLEKYDNEKIDKRALLFKEKLTVDIVLSALVFTVALVQVSSEHMQASLESQTEEQNESK